MCSQDSLERRSSVPLFSWPWSIAAFARPVGAGTAVLLADDELVFLLLLPHATSVTAAATSTTAISSGFRFRTKMTLLLWVTKVSGRNADSERPAIRLRPG